MQTIVPKTRKRYSLKSNMQEIIKVLNLTLIVGDGCGDDSYSESNPIEQYLVEFEDNDTMEIGPVHSTRKLVTRNLDGLKHKPPDRESISTRKMLLQGHMDHITPSPSQRGVHSLQ
ncbi:hypothetical protein O181_062207 [Austropuccinia psidii MF-1]|uniref:Uncharacterized protein n=1 Tax=Austropuccinia psidii MF-1 TaxID=1389203 RepID=A0A9Q3I058_9BASI|nr:hypothetical protein [Austropuccinia psidii MF-1]